MSSTTNRSGSSSRGSAWTSRSSVGDRRIPRGLVASHGSTPPTNLPLAHNNSTNGSPANDSTQNVSSTPLSSTGAVAAYRQYFAAFNNRPRTPPTFEQVAKSPEISNPDTSSTFRPKPELAEIPTLRSKEPLLEAQRLDLCFLLDASRTMQSSIYMVKQSVAEIADGIKAVYPNCKIRVAIVIYRDYEDPTTDCAVRNFTSDFEGSSSKIFKYLSSVLAMGGGDQAKDVFTGLERATDLDWEARNRLLVHITNAPCHGARFHDPSHRISDSYASGDKSGRSITALLMALRQRCKINRYFFCHLTSYTKRMIQEFKRVSKNDEHFHWIKDGDFTQGNSIQDSVVLIGRSTIRATLASFSNVRAGSAGPSPSAWRILREFPRMANCDWEKIGHVQARQYKHKQYSSLDLLLRQISTRQPLEIEQINSVSVQLSSSPFNGSLHRLAFYAVVGEPSWGSSLRVAKSFKSHLGRDSPLHYFKQMDVRTVSDHMARNFNERTRFGAKSIPNLQQVMFSTPVTTINVGSGFYNMEEYLQDRWIKYSDNAGYVNTEEYAETLQAFSHWTYDRSDGVLMVTDFQGVYKTDDLESRGTYNFLLCDPVIHCSDIMRFTSTNLGETGFDIFFQSHQCNDICRYLGLLSTDGYSTKR